MTAKILYQFALLGTLSAACNGGSGGENEKPREVVTTEFPYCSPTLGPLTEEQATQAPNAALCPPSNVTDYVSATCAPDESQAQAIGPEGGPVADASGPAWACKIEVGNLASASAGPFSSSSGQP